MEMLISSTLFSFDVWAKAHLARLVIPVPQRNDHSKIPFPGSRSTAQADTRFVRSQIHQQDQMCEDEGRGKYHPGAQAARGGTHFPEFSKPRSGASYLTLLRFCRSTIRSLSTCGMRSRTMRIVSSFSISCWVVTCAVRIFSFRFPLFFLSGSHSPSHGPHVQSAYLLCRRQSHCWMRLHLTVFSRFWQASALSLYFLCGCVGLFTRSGLSRADLVGFHLLELCNWIRHCFASSAMLA